jgi:hypothetical protein
MGSIHLIPARCLTITNWLSLILVKDCIDSRGQIKLRHSLTNSVDILGVGKLIGDNDILIVELEHVVRVQLEQYGVVFLPGDCKSEWTFCHCDVDVVASCRVRSILQREMFGDVPSVVVWIFDGEANVVLVNVCFKS